MMSELRVATTSIGSMAGGDGEKAPGEMGKTPGEAQHVVLVIKSIGFGNQAH